MSTRPNDGPSESGFHFVQAYQNCKRKFHYRYIRGLEPVYQSPAILLGTCGHAGMEEWYLQHQQGSQTSKKIKFATDRAITEIESRRDQYYDPAKMEVHKRQLRDIFQQYGLHYSTEPFRVLDIESSLSAPLTYGDMLTGRLDLTVLRNDGQLMIYDHKFTGWSLDNFKRASRASDQTTAYMFLWNHNNPKRRCAGVVYNIIRDYQGKIEFAQVPVYRSQEDIDLFVREVSENMRDLSQRVIDAEATWPKNTDHCYSYNRACPYLELCQGIKYDGLIGTKFKEKEQHS